MGRQHTAWVVVGAPDKRPYDVVAQNPDNGEWTGIDAGVAGPSRHGRLSTGGSYFGRGRAAALLVHRKKCAYGRLTKNCTLRRQVDYKAVGAELPGGLGKAAAELMNGAGKYAEAARVSKVSAPDWTWSAQDFTSYWMMRISFVACRLTALAVLHGVQSSMKAHESLT